ncbi:MAG: 7TM diverse intracellular signaling domain-containing protein [Bacteroidota bacterium]
MRQLLLNKTLVLLLLFFISGNLAKADDVVFNGGSLLIGKHATILNDSLNKLSLSDVINSKSFVNSTTETPNFDISNSTYWIKFSIRNKTDINHLLFEVDNALIDTCSLYLLKDNATTLISKLGVATAFSNRKYKYPSLLFDINIPTDSANTYLLKVKSSEQLIVPMIVGTNQTISESQNTKDLLSGLHIGILLVMIFYNLFLFLSIRDKSYLYYIIYILFIGLAQITLTGYSFKYLFPNSPYFFNIGIVVFPCIAGIFAVFFIRSFLNTRKETPVLDYFLLFTLLLFVIAAATRLLGNDLLSSRFVDITDLFSTVVVYIVAIKLSIRGYRPAKFFLLAWTIFIAGIILFVLRNFNLLPYSNFTNYTMELGTIFEVTLLSIALADKINILDKEKKASQAHALVIAQENERIVREQNVILETKVNERTVELQASNKGLNKALIDLKEAESHLVESEKMASLGQLTAGIAHEINNPINFVTSNVSPLKRDVNILMEALEQIESLGTSDIPVAEKQQKIEELKAEIDYDYLKTEIDYLLKGITEGSNRTAEIVKGLRIFSRLDEDDLKKADINEGIDSTLVITNNLMNNKIEVIKQYGELPLVECYPGKLNQVFMNIITNAIHALNKKFGDNKGGTITISTSYDASKVYIKIADNATGMDEVTKKKLFEPFFTTKDVGEGTGLGLSIAYNTIKKHNGQILVKSTLGEGTEFIIELPLQ